MTIDLDKDKRIISELNKTLLFFTNTRQEHLYGHHASRNNREKLAARDLACIAFEYSSLVFGVVTHPSFSLLVLPSQSVSVGRALWLAVTMLRPAIGIKCSLVDGNGDSFGLGR